MFVDRLVDTKKKYNPNKIILQYTGSQSETGMVVMEVEMVSGLLSKFLQTKPLFQFLLSLFVLQCYKYTFFWFCPISFDLGWEARFSEIESLVNDVNYEIQRVER